MGRFFYKHFDSSIPKYIEAEYNKLLRHEKYLEEKEMEYCIRTINFDDVLKWYPDPETENNNFLKKRLKLLEFGLSVLKKEYPEGYDLLVEYYLGDVKVSMNELGRKYGISSSKVKYRIENSKLKLFRFITKTENQNI